jgi:hypothetical protein
VKLDPLEIVVPLSFTRPSLSDAQRPARKADAVSLPVRSKDSDHLYWPADDGS